MKTNKNALAVLIVGASLILSSCAPQPATTPPPARTLPSMPTIVPTFIPGITPAPSATPTQTAPLTTSPFLPALTLKPGNFYFSMDGQTQFIFSRNAAGFFYEDLGTMMDWMLYNGDHVLRIGVENFLLGGYGYTNTGELNEQWAPKWDAFLTQAEAHGLYIVPVFTGWANWNTSDYNTWKDNPFNPAKGGPAQSNIAKFQEGSPAQKLYLGWAGKVATRWQNHKNILAWEVLCEGNLINGITEQQGIAFIEHMAEVIRAADSNHRPITAALADVGTWPNYYKTDAIDLIQVHPYTGKLDRLIIDEVHQELAAYNKPVLIGESGLDGNSLIPPPMHRQGSSTPSGQMWSREL